MATAGLPASTTIPTLTTQPALPTTSTLATKASIGFLQTTWITANSTLAETYSAGNLSCPSVSFLPDTVDNLLIFGVVNPAGFASTILQPGSSTSIPFSCLYSFSDSQTTPPSFKTTETTLPASKKTETENPPILTETKAPETSSISPSAASGIGIGAFILGLAIGLAFAACYILRRGRAPKTVQSPKEERSAMLIPAVPPIPPAKDPSPTQSTPRSTAAILPTLIGQTNSSLHGASDETLASELAFLGQLIRDHASNNYHLEPVNIDINVLKQSLGGLNLDEGTQDQIATLAMEPHTRCIAIRHLLALAIFSAVDIDYAHGRSLLPDGVAAFIKGLPFEKGGDSRGATTALDRWRRASSYLLQGNTDKHTPLSPGPDTKSQIDEFQSALNRFLCHFTHEDSRAVFDQTKNLEGVIQECVVFGYAVFSHPCLWRFTYVNQSDSEKTSLVVLPGLEKLSGRDGVVFERVEMLAAPSVTNV